MFGRSRKHPKKRVVHTPECTAIHEAMLMSLYLGYGAPSAPLFVPTGSLVCTCDQDGGGAAPPTEVTQDPTDANLRSVLVAV